MLRIVGMLGVVCAGLACMPASADEAPKGSIMLAKTQPNVILIWDATPAVADLVTAKLPVDEALHALEADAMGIMRSEEHTSELQSHLNLVCRLLLEKKR